MPFFKRICLQIEPATKGSAREKPEPEERKPKDRMQEETGLKAGSRDPVRTPEEAEPPDTGGQPHTQNTVRQSRKNPACSADKRTPGRTGFAKSSRHHPPSGEKVQDTGGSTAFEYRHTILRFLQKFKYY